jgi:serine-type D-Ala-D-Ala carboxypeptidase (penicillin-binding protein 5/6)
MDERRILRSHPALLIVLVALGAALLSGVVLAATSSRVPAAAGAETAAASAPRVGAASGILIDRRTGRVLWSKGADLRLAPASCTKIMTALLVLERYRDLDRMVRAPAVVTAQQKVAIGLRPGDRISVRQALRAVMIKSANDACVTLATAVAGSETGFVKLMNRRAAQLRLTRTRFVNSRGSAEPGHHSSARDLARLGRYAMRDARFRDLVGTKTRLITWPPSHTVRVTSHNRLLDYPWGDGIKTGSTEQSLRVLVGSGKPGLVPLIVVTMREPTRDQEERDAIALFTWGSAQYEQRQIVAAGDIVAELTVSGESPVGVATTAGLTAVVRRAATVTLVFDLPPEPLAPRPADGDLLGTVTYRSDGLILGRVDLVAATIPAASPSP